MCKLKKNDGTMTRGPDDTILCQLVSKEPLLYYKIFHERALQRTKKTFLEEYYSKNPDLPRAEKSERAMAMERHEQKQSNPEFGWKYLM